MGYAQHVGRVGALAVALGVGVAVVTGYGAAVACADETGTTETPPGVTPDPPSLTSENDEVSPATDSNDPAPDPTEDGAAHPGMQVGNSGGQHTSINDQGQYTDTNADDGTDNEARLADPPSTTTPEPPAPEMPPAAEIPPSPPDQSLDQSLQDQAQDHSVATTETSLQAVDPSAGDPDLGDVNGSTGDGELTQIGVFSALGAQDIGAPGNGRMMATFAGSEMPGLVTTTALPAPLVPQPSGPVDAVLGLPGVVASIATTVVGLMVAPFLAPGPVAPAQPPLLFAMLEFVRRQIQRTFFNSTPKAGVDDVTTSEDVATTIPVLTNDTDSDGDTVTVTALSQPRHGITVLNSDGTITYTPDADFSGTDSFTYRISDAASPWHIHGLAGFFGGGGHTETVTVNVAVTGVNDPPLAEPDTYTTVEDVAVIVDALTNDSDPEGDPLDRKLTSAPRNGSLAEINQGPNAGAWTYTPNRDFHGTDTFTYQAFDGSEFSDPVTVTITVTPANDPPTAVGNTATVAEDSIANPIDVLPDDSDPDGDALTVTTVTQGANGSAHLVDGSVTYTPNANFHGTDSFTYTISDGNGGTATATVSVTVTGVNDPPNAIGDTATVTEDSRTNTIEVLAGDTDIDGDTLTVIAVTQGANGSVHLVDGSVTYTPNANFSGSDSFTYTISDGNGGTATATAAVTVTDENDDPTVANPIPDQNATEGGAFTYQIPSNAFADIDGDALTYTTGTLPNWLSFDPATRTFTGTPARADVGTATITVTATDAAGQRVTDTFVLTVVVSPITANDDAYTVDEGTYTDLTPALTANDTTTLGSALGAVKVVTEPTNGLLFETNGVLSYRPRNNFTGTDTFTYTVADSANPDIVSNVATVTVTVVGPITANDDAYTVDEGTYTDLTPALTANDTTTLGSALGAVKVVTEPTNGLLFETNGVLSYRPRNNFTGTDTFTYTVADRFNPDIVSNVATVTVTVVPYNPLKAADDAYTILGRPTVLTPAITANDTTDLGRPLGAVTVVSGPAHGTLSTTGDGLTYTPNSGYVGSDSFTYTVSDSVDPTQKSVPATVVLNVIAYNPILANADAYSIPFETPTVLTPGITANDTTDLGHPLGAVTVVKGPAHGTLSATGGALTYTPDTGYVGSDSFTYTVADSVDPTQKSVPATVQLTVHPYSPIVARNDVYTVLSGTFTPMRPAITANDTTTANGLGRITILTEPTHGYLTEENGELTYRAGNGYTGTDSFTYIVADSGYPDIVSNPATVTLTIVDSLPVRARDDRITVFTNEPIALTEEMVSNDRTEADGPVGAITVLTQPAHGTLTEINGILTYTPDAEFRGEDSFLYTAADSVDPTVVSLPARVTLIVTDPIRSQNDFYWVPAGVSTELDPPLTANDVTYTGNPLGAPVIFGQPLGGAVTVVGNRWTFTPKAGFTGLTTFGYRVTDSVNPAWSDTATVFITVTAD
ncbi:Ig-like domain-containing protein [Mycobacterium sp. 29Ha]|uniref:Ig-like domain-containing protein n=1 Tax=Mycobacterium sp. 29Ha TaxID=2939268 RepID=UPI0029394487|nr:Ig-like domain-containing protein [Mycobacterium sp. 29Ha]